VSPTSARDSHVSAAATGTADATRSRGVTAGCTGSAARFRRPKPIAVLVIYAPSRASWAKRSPRSS
jgi:hypothetical protein